MSRGSDPGKLREWRQRLARFERGGLSIAQFCRNEGVSAASFYQWRRKLAPRVAPPRSGRADDVVSRAASGFTPVRVVASAGVSVRLPGGTQLDVPLVDAEALALVIATVIRADAERGGADAC